MENVTTARACAQTTEEPSWLPGYRPQRINAGIWRVIRPFVIGCAERLALDESPNGLRTARVLALLAEWCVSEGLDVDLEIVLDPATVERFVAVGLKGNRSQSTYRAVLRRVGPLLTRHAGWEPTPATYGRLGTALPYSPSELRALKAAAGSQPTRARRRAARAILALGAGAGLDGRWVAQITPSEVIADRNGVAIQVGAPEARLVPVLAEWHAEVLDVTATAGTAFLVGGTSTSRNRASALVSYLVVGHGQPKFSMSRLRSTWLVRHLELGTRLPELAHAAGLADTRVLSDLLTHVPAMETADALRALQGIR